MRILISWALMKNMKLWEHIRLHPCIRTKIIVPRLLATRVNEEWAHVFSPDIIVFHPVLSFFPWGTSAWKLKLLRKHRLMLSIVQSNHFILRWLWKIWLLYVIKHVRREEAQPLIDLYVQFCVLLMKLWCLLVHLFNLFFLYELLPRLSFWWET